MIRPIPHWAIATFALFLASLGLSTQAEADLVLTFERISDTQAILTGSGNVNNYDNQGGRNFFRFINAPTTNSGTATLSDNTAKIGVSPFLSAFPFASEIEFRINQPPNLSAFSGMVTIDLSGGATWSAVGSSGDILWGNGSTVQGTWTMVSAVPEPTSFAMFGIAMLGLSRRRRLR